MDRIDMSGPWVTEHEISVVEDCMRNGWNSYHYVETFEKEFAEYHERRYGLMTPNCTAALHLLLMGLGIQDDDEVILPEHTWIATAAPIIYVRAKPVFTDIEPLHWCLDPQAVRRSITPATRAVIAVDIYGNMPLMDELVAICDDAGIPLIEDAAEAVGSIYKGRRAGKFGIGSVFSFHRTKTIVTGEGGMLLLDDTELFERCQMLRDHGRRPGDKMYFNEAVTCKYMPFSLQAAMGYAQFQRIDELVGKKRWILDTYREKLADLDDIALNTEPAGGCNGAWTTAMLIGESHGMDKQGAIEKLEAMDLPGRPFFYPLSSLPAFAGKEEIYRPRNPVAYDVCNRGINLPSSLLMTEEQMDFICDGLHKLLA